MLSAMFQALGKEETDMTPTVKGWRRYRFTDGPLVGNRCCHCGITSVGQSAIRGRVVTNYANRFHNLPHLGAAHILCFDCATAYGYGLPE